jgi:co-chaperonin GroES (HSP10)
MIIPKGHRVLIKPDEVESQTATGIILVQDERLAKGGNQFGTIVSVGKQAWKAFREVDENGKEVNGRPWAEVGDRVIFAKYAGKFVYDPTTGTSDKDREEYLIINDEDIVAVIKDEKEV